MAVKSAHATATGTLVSAPARLLGVYMSFVAGAGDVVFRDGGAGGAVLLTLTTPQAVGSSYVPVAGGGLQFTTDVHVTIAGADSVTAIYEGP